MLFVQAYSVTLGLRLELVLELGVVLIQISSKVGQLSMIQHVTNLGTGTHTVATVFSKYDTIHSSYSLNLFVSFVSVISVSC